MGTNLQKLSEKTTRPILSRWTTQILPKELTLLLPTLSSFINHLEDALNQTGIGLQFGNADKLASLLFADDIVLLAESVEDLQKLTFVESGGCTSPQVINLLVARQ